MPVITNLRNPSLKGRHWEQIEQIVSHKFSPEEPLNLKLLTELNAFEHSEAIQEVSGQASAEAALETMLKKVTTHSCAVCSITTPGGGLVEIH